MVVYVKKDDHDLPHHKLYSYQTVAEFIDRAKSKTLSSGPILVGVQGFESHPSY
jgi:hypothetical protein